MSIAIITGSAGLIGSEAVKHFAEQGMDVIGIDNNMRAVYFGEEASTLWVGSHLRRSVMNYRQHSMDIRDREAVFDLFRRYGDEINLVVHTAAQPSPEWAAREPLTDFGVNALGTLTMLEATRLHSPNAVFIFTSTNKVYGDTPNRLPMVELPTRWEITPDHTYLNGVDETMSIDQSTHSMFGVSKVSADVMVQEYGRYYGMQTACFRSGCLTGPGHAGIRLHGFLAYLLKCTVNHTHYQVIGHGGKQVRDNIHSYDLVQAFDAFFKAPRVGEVYNIGGGRFSSCSMMEAIALCEEIAAERLHQSYLDTSRIGDHQWWISDVSKFSSHYPEWKLTYDVKAILQESYTLNVDRWIKEREGFQVAA